MKRKLLTILLAVMPVMAAVRGDAGLEKFYASIAESCLEVSYTYSARVSGIVNNGGGTLVTQGTMWKVQGNGVEMYCDSKTLWVIDPAMKEVVVEPASAEASSEFMDNPALMFSRLKDNFNVSESRPMGEDVMFYTLRPKSDIGINYFNVELDVVSNMIRRASFAMADGTFVKIEVSSMKLTPEVSVESFRPVDRFDSEWIVTDLR